MLIAAIRSLIRHPRLAAGAVLISIALAALGAAKVEFRFQFSDFYDYPGNTQMPAFRRLIRDFGDGRYIVVAISSPDVLQPESLRYISAVSRALAPEPIVGKVRSLTAQNVPRASRNGVEIGPLVPTIPESREQIDQLRNTIRGSSLVLRRLVSDDFTTAAVLVEPRKPMSAATIPEQKEALQAVAAALARVQKPADVRAFVTGSSAVEVETTRALIRDQLVMTPVVLALIALALFATFRSLQGVLLPMAAVATSVIWTIGVFGWLGKSADMMASVIPITLLVYGVVDPVFVYTRYMHHIDAGLSREPALLTALRELMLPCFLTSLSTTLGFLAFGTATLPTISNFGLIVGVGVALAFVTTISVLPILVMLLPAPGKALAESRSARLVDRSLQRLWGFIAPRRPLVIAAAVAILGLGIATYHELRVVNVYVGLLPDGQTVRDVNLLDRKLSGVVVHSVHLTGAPGAMQQPEVLQAIERIDDFAQTQASVGSSTSLADLVADMNQAFNDGERSMRRVPKSGALIAQYIALLDPSDRGALVSDDLSSSEIRMSVSDPGSLETKQFIDRVEAVVAEQHLERHGVTATVTGARIAYHELDALVDEVVVSFAIAFAIIVALQWLLFRSATLAVASILPNLVPVAAAFITMRLLGIDLRMDNSLVLCVCVGGLFNTTIHLTSRTLQQLREGARDFDAIVERSLRAVGPPSLYTAAVLSAGFSVLLLSQFPGMRMFGLLCAVTLLVGFISDAAVSTVLLRVLAPSIRLARARLETSSAPVAGLQNSGGHP